MSTARYVDIGEEHSTTTALAQDPWGRSVCYGQGYDWSAGDLWGGNHMSSTRGVLASWCDASLAVGWHSKAFNLVGC